MPTSYFERHAALTEIMVSLDTAKRQEAQAVLMLSDAKLKLDSLPTKLKLFLDDISADAGKLGAYKNQSEVADIVMGDVLARSQIVDAKVKALAAIEG